MYIANDGSHLTGDLTTCHSSFWWNEKATSLFMRPTCVRERYSFGQVKQPLQRSEIIAQILESANGDRVRLTNYDRQQKEDSGDIGRVSHIMTSKIGISFYL